MIGFILVVAVAIGYLIDGLTGAAWGGVVGGVMVVALVVASISVNS